jgi:hypothetical protein
MMDNELEANVGSGRRQFLHIGAGLVGSITLGSLLAACGAPATQPPAVSEGTSSNSATLKAYLIIARYNREKWKSLSGNERQEAEEAAEVLFPEKPASLSKMEGVLTVHTFHTGIHAKIPSNYRSLPSNKQDELMENIFKEFDGRSTTALDPGAGDPGIGWIAVVDADHFSSFLKSIGGTAGPLWHMYDVEALPLNNDQTTADIYEFMTPTSWGHKGS